MNCKLCIHGFGFFGVSHPNRKEARAAARVATKRADRAPRAAQLHQVAKKASILIDFVN